MEINTKEFEKYLQECKELLLRKNHDYTSGDPFKNFRTVVRYGINPVDGFIVRMNDKVQRLNNLIFERKENLVKNESIEDTIMDLINYTILLYSYCKLDNNNNNLVTHENFNNIIDYIILASIRLDNITDMELVMSDKETRLLINSKMTTFDHLSYYIIKGFKKQIGKSGDKLHLLATSYIHYIHILYYIRITYKELLNKE